MFKISMLGFGMKIEIVIKKIQLMFVAVDKAKLHTCEILLNFYCVIMRLLVSWMTPSILDTSVKSASVMCIS